MRGWWLTHKTPASFHKGLALQKYATADLPDLASDVRALAADTTLNVAKYWDGSSWATIAASGATADAVYNAGAWTVDVDSKDVIFRMSNTGYNVLIDVNVTGTTAEALVIDAKHNTSTITDAVKITTSGTSGVVTNALNLSDAGITNALVAGANDLSGTNWSITGATGAIAAAGDVAINTDAFTVNATTKDVTVGNDLTVDNDLTVTGTLTAGTFAVSAIQPGSGNLTINGAAGATTITIGNLSTGGITIADNMTISQPTLVSGTNAINFYDTAIGISSSVDGQMDIDADVEVEITTATLDVNAGTAIALDTAAFSIDGTSSSNVSVTGAQLQLATLTSGELDITSAGLIDINAAANLDIDVTGNYTMDATGTVSVAGVGNSDITIDTGDLVLATTTSGTMDLNAVANFELDAGGTISLDGVGASNFTADSGNLTLQTTTSGSLILDGVALVDINAGANLDIDVTGTVDILASGAFSIDGTGASNVSATSGNLTLSSITSGSVDILSATDVDIDASGTSGITLNTADEATADATATGSITLTAGDKGAGTGDGGSIVLVPGDTTGGTAGSVDICSDGAGHDFIWYSSSAGDNITLDASADDMLVTDIDVFLDDDANLQFGNTAAAPDATIASDGTHLTVTGGASADIYLAPKGNAAAGAVIVGDLTTAGESELHIKGDDDGDHDPGFLVLYDHNGNDYFLWVDSAGDLRINGTKPANELADGTVVGTQS